MGPVRLELTTSGWLWSLDNQIISCREYETCALANCAKVPELDGMMWLIWKLYLASVEFQQEFMQTSGTSHDTTFIRKGLVCL